MTTTMAEQGKQTIIDAVRNYGKKLFSFIRGRVDTNEDAEDILQDVWYQFGNLLNSQPIEQTSAWLYRVARNRIIDKYRKPKSEPIDELFGDEEESEFNPGKILLADPPDAEAAMLRDLFWEQLFNALDELPLEQKQVFIWNELEDRPFEEISKQTGENINTLLSRKRYAVLHLRKQLQQLYAEIIEQ